MSKYFIKHPTIAIVIALVMIILGVLMLMRLPVEQYPNIVPPAIKLAAAYPGADAQTVANSVASPIEQSMSGVLGMDYMNSTNANNGAYSLTITFAVGTDPDMDQTLANMRYGQATAQLPTVVSQMGVSFSQSSGNPVLVITLYSPTDVLDSIYLSNYAYVSLVDPIKRVPGVGEVMVFGSGRYAMRVWVDPIKMASLGITVSEITNAIQTQNTVNPGGQIGAEPAPEGQEFTYTVRAKSRLQTPAEFGNIIVRAEGEKLVYLKDVAKVELGSQSYGLTSYFNEQHTGAICIYQAPGTNSIEMVDNVKGLMEERSKAFPAGMEYSIMLDSTLAVRESIKEIEHTLLEALLLVVAVVFLFLQGWRATLIPAIAVPVSIVFTFALFPLLGFTMNTICLMGMVLAIGLVVDDAIVVVEAVESHIERGLTPRQATFAAMEEVSGPVVAIALVLAAVFLPSLLMTGITGTLFQQFAVTIAVSMLISAFNALTLSPALSAILLKPKNHNARGPIQWFYKKFNKGYDAAATGFTKVCGGMIRKLWITLPLLGIITYFVVPLNNSVPGGFLPDEDPGYVLVGVQLPLATSLQRTAEATTKLSALLRENKAIQDVVGVSGFNLLNGVQSTNSGFFFVTLKPWEERKEEGEGAEAITNYISTEVAAKFSEGVVFAFMPPAIPGVGTSNGVSAMLEDRAGKGLNNLVEQTNAYVAALNNKEQCPEIIGVNVPMMNDVPQIQAEIDYEKCYTLGVDVHEANAVLQTFLGSSFVNYISLYGQQWQVYVQAEGEARTDISKLKNFNIKTKHGNDVPMSAILRVSEFTAPEFIIRNNLYMSSQLNVAVADGYTTTQAMQRMESVFAATVDPDMGLGYTGMSYQEQKAAKGLSLPELFALSSIFVFLILAALYERWTLPISIFVTIPIAVVGAYLGLYLFHIELNLYAQIGLIMLIGLAAKNAILIVEFAVLEMERGTPLYEATLSAAKLRLRPILMTSFAFILGCLPLALASGSGAVSRNAIGIVVIAGMLVATFVGIFFIPTAFYMIMRLFGIKIAAENKHISKADPDEEIALKHLQNSNTHS